MADTGQPWRVASVARDFDLPPSRLSFAAVSSNYVILSYEHGTYDPHASILIFDLRQAQKPIIWSAESKDVPKTLEEFRRDLATFEFDDTRFDPNCQPSFMLSIMLG